MQTAGYEEEISKWRQGREAALRAPGGWLTVTALSWLDKPQVRCGSGRGCEVVLEGAGVREHAFPLRLLDGAIVADPAPGVTIQTGRGPLTARPLVPDQAPN